MHLAIAALATGITDLMSAAGYGSLIILIALLAAVLGSVETTAAQARE